MALLQRWRLACKNNPQENNIILGFCGEGFFSIAFHFNERYSQGVQKLLISDELKKTFLNTPANGSKITSLVIDIYSKNDLPDVYKLIEYKKRAK